MLAVQPHRHAGAPCTVSPDRRFDGRAHGWRADDDGFVDTLDLAGLDPSDEAGVRTKRSRDEHESRRVLVQPMHETGARDGPKPRVVCEQPIEEGSVAIAGTGMHHQPRWLVDHEHVRICVKNCEGPRLCLRQLVVLDGAEDADLLTPRDPILDPHRRTVKGGGPSPGSISGCEPASAGGTVSRPAWSALSPDSVTGTVPLSSTSFVIDHHARRVAGVAGATSAPVRKAGPHFSPGHGRAQPPPCRVSVPISC